MDTRGEHRFSSLMKQNKKAKICAVFCFAGKRKILFYIYAVIVKQNFYKRPTNHYYYTDRTYRESIMPSMLSKMYVTTTQAHADTSPANKKNKT